MLDSDRQPPPPLDPDDGMHRTSSRGKTLVLGGVAVAVMLVVWWNRSPPVRVDHLITEAAAALQRGDLETAERCSRRLLDVQPKNGGALLILGRCLEARGRARAAIEAYDRVTAGTPAESAEAAWRSGHLYLLTLGQPSQAERCYLQALAADPDSLMAHEGLTVLWGFSGQWWRQIRPRLAMFRRGNIHRLHLLSLALAEESLDMSLDLGWMRRQAPEDPHVLMAQARLAIEDQDFPAAARLLRQVLNTTPDLVQAHVYQGEIHLEQHDARRFREWHDRLPSAADSHPSIWALRGRWALAEAQPDPALRCFCEAILRDANHPEALYQAGRLLTDRQQTEAAEPLLARASRLQEYRNAVRAVDTDQSHKAMRRAAELAESLGNEWEATAWATLAVQQEPTSDWARDMLTRLQPHNSTRPLVRTVEAANPAASFDFASLPLPEFASEAARPLSESASAPWHPRLSFRNDAARASLDFQYFNASTDIAHGTRFMYETMGGGIGVVDIDGDWHPDLWLTQGCRWPVNEIDFTHIDRIYRNRGDGRFVDVTALTGVHENRFSQGIAAGDINNDGFPDIVVGNIGRNRLYVNLGDGTFADVSEQANFSRSDWTTSCAIADLTADGNPEVYFVNYLKGPDVFTRTCGADGQSVCMPQHFAAADDQLLWNRGDGELVDVSATSGIADAPGKGLGVLIADFEGAGLPNIFVANDTEKNAYFVNRSQHRHEPPRLTDMALMEGLAMSADGRTQACMGIAAGDADGDGHLDLFVTNFHGESNACYTRLGNSFQDTVADTGLRLPGISRLGFGTQFLDVDLDGREDLIVANGHIDNYTDDGRTEYQMPAQLFASTGAGRFTEVSSSQAGDYFRQRHLGRSLARLDWNGDGRSDAVILHLDAPVALLTNVTEPSGGFLTIRLRGTRSGRDAIGTVVEVEQSGMLIRRQLTAGDGFQASNERILHFGLGPAASVPRLSIRWPSGIQHEYGPLEADTHWVAIEGSDQLIPLSSRVNALNPASRYQP